MSDILISEAEKIYIVHGIQENLRCDGRSCLEYRFMELETGLVPNCSGSSHVRLANTDILVGIKAELDAPDPCAPHLGRIEFFVDCTANADPVFEGRGGEEIATEIRSALAHTYSSPKCLDLASLAVVPGHQAWVLYVDVLILECGGSLIDAVSVAVKAALYDLKIPKVSVNIDDNGDPEIEVSDNPHDVNKINIANVPCFITLSKVGQQFVLDATQEEQACAVGSLAMAVTETGKVAALFKGGIGSLHPENIVDIIEVGRDVGIALNTAVSQQLKLEGSVKKERKGFLL
uniref:Ribosomal RNA-processing protein 42 n=1 Tax=Hyalomma excavatum TaxID=257692 RepID=A0A131XFS0_9ACAR